MLFEKQAEECIAPTSQHGCARHCTLPPPRRVYDLFAPLRMAFEESRDAVVLHESD